MVKLTMPPRPGLQEGFLPVGIRSPWFYDILSMLVAMAEIGLVRDRRCQDALELLESKRLSEPDSGLACGEAGPLRRAQWSSPAAQKRITLGFRVAAEDQILPRGRSGVPSH